MSTSASAQTTTPGPRTYRGSCHCGAVRFEADFDPSAGTIRCNCTLCTKTGWWCVHVKPSAFRVVEGQEVLGDYSRTGVDHDHFCKTCGVRFCVFRDVPEMGGAFYSVNLNCLDGADLTGAPVMYLDGRSNTWEQIAVAPHVDPFTAVKRS